MEASTAVPRPSEDEPSLDDRLDTAARGGGVDAAGEDAMLAYFLGNAPAPGEKNQETLTVEIGDGREWTCTLKSIGWAEWREAQDKAINVSTGISDMYVQASWVVARATVNPKLGRMLAQIRDAAGTDEEAQKKVPSDGAAMLRSFFQKQSGSLIVLQRNVLRLSSLDEESGGNVKVKEVEAGKP